MAKREEPAQGDVLVYYRSTRRMGVVWNDPVPRGSKGATVPMQHRYVIQPRLGFVPADRWAIVSASPAYVEAVEAGTLRALAGHQGDLAAGIVDLRARALAEMIERSAGLKALDRLQAIESAADNPRVEISEAIEIRKKDLAVEVAKAKRQNKADRRANQRRMKRQSSDWAA